MTTICDDATDADDEDDDNSGVNVMGARQVADHVLQCLRWLAGA